MPSMGAARAAVGVRRNGLAGAETRHLSVTPGQERERWATTRPPAVAHGSTETQLCMYARHLLIFFINHGPLLAELISRRPHWVECIFYVVKISWGKKR